MGGRGALSLSAALTSAACQSFQLSHFPVPSPPAHLQRKPVSETFFSPHPDPAPCFSFHLQRLTCSLACWANPQAGPFPPGLPLSSREASAEALRCVCLALLPPHTSTPSGSTSRYWKGRTRVGLQPQDIPRPRPRAPFSLHSPQVRSRRVAQKLSRQENQILMQYFFKSKLTQNIDNG